MVRAREIARLLLESGAVLLRPEEPFRFASGIFSPIYCDNRILLSSKNEREKVIDGFLELIEASKAEQVVGVATAGVAWGAWVADRLGANFGYVRGAAKEHGRQNRIEGKLHPNLRTVLIEDLVSTGGSVISAAQALEASNIKPADIFAIFSYGFTEAEEAFQKNSYRFVPMVTVDLLLKIALELKKISPEQAQEIQKWKTNPREWKLAP